MGTFRYALRDAFRLLGRHWGLALLTLVTATAVFFLVGGSALLVVNTSRLVARVEGELVIHAFLKSDKNMEALREKVRQYPGVAEVREVTVYMARRGLSLSSAMCAVNVAVPPGGMMLGSTVAHPVLVPVPM